MHARAPAHHWRTAQGAGRGRGGCNLNPFIRDHCGCCGTHTTLNAFPTPFASRSRLRCKAESVPWWAKLTFHARTCLPPSVLFTFSAQLHCPYIRQHAADFTMASELYEIEAVNAHSVNVSACISARSPHARSALADSDARRR